MAQRKIIKVKHLPETDRKMFQDITKKEIAALTDANIVYLQARQDYLTDKQYEYYKEVLEKKITARPVDHSGVDKPPFMVEEEEKTKVDEEIQKKHAKFVKAKHEAEVGKDKVKAEKKAKKIK